MHILPSIIKNSKEYPPGPKMFLLVEARDLQLCDSCSEGAADAQTDTRNGGAPVSSSNSMGTSKHVGTFPQLKNVLWVGSEECQLSFGSVKRGKSLQDASTGLAEPELGCQPGGQVPQGLSQGFK